jgi:hypothetical protein
MRMSRLTFLVVACIGLGCRETARHEAYDAIHAQTRHQLRVMRPQAETILNARPNDHVTIAKACMQNEWFLLGFLVIPLTDPRLGLERHNPWDNAEQLLIRRCVMCGRESISDPVERWPEHRLEMCASWCRAEWTELVEAAEHMRGIAAEEGIELPSLRPAATR